MRDPEAAGSKNRTSGLAKDIPAAETSVWLRSSLKAAPLPVVPSTSAAGSKNRTSACKGHTSRLSPPPAVLPSIYATTQHAPPHTPSRIQTHTPFGDNVLGCCVFGRGREQPEPRGRLRAAVIGRRLQPAGAHAGAAVGGVCGRNRLRGSRHRSRPATLYRLPGAAATPAAAPARRGRGALAAEAESCTGA